MFRSDIFLSRELFLFFDDLTLFFEVTGDEVKRECFNERERFE